MPKGTASTQKRAGQALNACVIAYAGLLLHALLLPNKTNMSEFGTTTRTYRQKANEHEPTTYNAKVNVFRTLLNLLIYTRLIYTTNVFCERTLLSLPTACIYTLIYHQCQNTFRSHGHRVRSNSSCCFRQGRRFHS